VSGLTLDIEKYMILIDEFAKKAWPLSNAVASHHSFGKFTNISSVLYCFANVYNEYKILRSKTI